MNNDTPITDKQAGWAIAGQYGISRGKDLMPDKDGPFVHACIARELERENARLREAGHAMRHLHLAGKPCSYHAAIAAWDAAVSSMKNAKVSQPHDKNV